MLIDNIRLKAEAADLLITGLKEVEFGVEKQLSIGEDFWWAALPPPETVSCEDVIMRARDVKGVSLLTETII